MPTQKAVGVKKYGPMKKKVGQKGRVMEGEMRRFGMGELHSGNKRGPVVKNRKQAIAIGLSEERKAGKPAAQKSKHATIGKNVLTQHAKEHAAMEGGSHGKGKRGKRANRKGR